jgi:hypothetical protein
VWVEPVKTHWLQHVHSGNIHIKNALNQELKRWSETPLSETATLKMGSLKTASSVELVVRGGREGRETGIPPSDSEIA